MIVVHEAFTVFVAGGLIQIYLKKGIEGERKENEGKRKVRGR